jgi:hypothetical protein
VEQGTRKRSHSLLILGVSTAVLRSVVVQRELDAFNTSGSVHIRCRGKAMKKMSVVGCDANLDALGSWEVALVFYPYAFCQADTVTMPNRAVESHLGTPALSSADNDPELNYGLDEICTRSSNSCNCSSANSNMRLRSYPSM